MQLDAFLDTLDAYRDAIPIDELVTRLRELDIARDDIAEWIGFAEDGYKRNLIRVGSAYAALILCWRDGQRSPIHDHQGSACGVRVVDGVASETQYTIGEGGRLVEGDTNHYPRGHVCGSYDDDIHVMYNEQGVGRELITLHVYTPPLSTIHMYRSTNGEVEIWTDHETQAALRAISMS